ncbi:hypothetical protein FGB62_4g049 [Gracilaria domingensis]|nr:hypothetical protein FGB62_4g049 [Gracilaria domingensis]
MYAFSVSNGGIFPIRSLQMRADDGEHKSPLRPARLSETSIEHRAGVIGGLPLFLAVGAIHQLRRFTHSAQRHAMVREIEKEMLRDETGRSTPELMEKMTRY